MKNRIIFWFYPLIVIGLVLIFISGCKKPIGTIPTVETGKITITSDTTAICDAKVISNGNVEITSRGICWSTGDTPGLGNFMTSEGIEVGSFSSKLTGLVPHVTYNVRAYCTNWKGVAYGSIVTITPGQ